MQERSNGIKTTLENSRKISKRKPDTIGFTVAVLATVGIQAGIAFSIFKGDGLGHLGPINPISTPTPSGASACPTPNESTPTLVPYNKP